jgi:hypothetical protein
VVRLWGVVVLVVPDAVVCASPADSAETSASVASVFSWIFIWPLFAVKSQCNHDAGKVLYKRTRVIRRGT